MLIVKTLTPKIPARYPDPSRRRRVYACISKKKGSLRGGEVTHSGHPCEGTM